MRASSCVLAIAAFFMAPALARADLGATSTRLSVNGQEARHYPTYGYQFGLELYAPIRTEIAGAGLEFRFSGSSAEVLVQGERKATWAVVRTPASVPSTTQTPTIILVGGTSYLPVRATAAVLGWEAGWDYSANQFRISKNDGTGPAAVVRARPAPQPTKPVQPAAAAHPAAGPQLSTSPEIARKFNAARAALSTAGWNTRFLSPAGRLLVLAAQPAADLVLKTVSAAPPAAPAVRAVVRRGSGALAFRGGLARRNPDDLFGTSSELRGKTICVDAGHGGHSTGAMGLNGLKEKEACLAMAIELTQALQASGATVIMPRADDVYISLDERIEFANSQNADLFVSIHCNAMPVHNTVSGTETYYFTPQSLELARAIHPEVVQVVASRDGGIRKRAFAVIRRTTMPSVLLEIAYIDNLKDEAKLSRPEFRRQVGESIRSGIVRYFENR